MRGEAGGCYGVFTPCQRFGCLPVPRTSRGRLVGFHPMDEHGSMVFCVEGYPQGLGDQVGGFDSVTARKVGSDPSETAL